MAIGCKFTSSESQTITEKLREKKFKSKELPVAQGIAIVNFLKRRRVIRTDKHLHVMVTGHKYNLVREKGGIWVNFAL